MKRQSYFFSILLTGILLISNCKKKDPDPTPEPTAPVTPSNLPVVITAAVTNVSDTSATCGGTVTSAGASAITGVGVCWDTLPAPTTLKNLTFNGAGTGNYTSKLTGLKFGTKYYVRAYAINYNGISYGDETNFTTASGWTQIKPTSAFNLSSISCMESTGATIYAGTNNGIFTSTDNGDTWKSSGLSGFYVNEIMISNGSLFAVAFSNGPSKIYRSTDNGSNWTLKINGMPNPVDVFAIVKIGTKLFAGTDSSAFFSTDNGDNWISNRSGLPATGYSQGFLNGGVSPMVATDKAVYGFAPTGNFKNLYYFINGGSSWGLTGISLNYSESLLDLKASGPNVLVSASDGNYISKNGGSWDPILGLPSGMRFAANGSIVFGSSQDKLYISANSGGSWTELGSRGITAFNAYPLHVSEDYLWVNTINGIYKYKL